MPSAEESLSDVNQLFLQRLLSAYVLTDRDAQNLYQQICSSVSEDEDDVQHPTFENALRSINSSLVPFFDLEIRTTVIPDSICSPKNNNNDAESDNNTPRKSKQSASKYHAVVNKVKDVPAKLHASSCNKGPHDVELFRLILEKIVEEHVEEETSKTDADEETEGSGGSSRKKRRKSRIKEPSVGCNGSLSRMEIINLRTELEGVHSGKISLPDAEARL
eukprot:CAMPEP_0194355212 /NCGR_PEP_ID=MMETSP0174-20130528/3172_1 /TAXON_ID=216777 /ORGANISM="Proboscia alata, Strain PI-D3" /LENGTH=218 /DNA_ID=CAMNT_0039124411 /DNA_START=95 /DNA_END=748 /DNA_ORIENTATION=+